MIEPWLELAAWSCLAIVYYVYDGYGRLLELLAWWRQPRSASDHAKPSRVTVVVTVFNEAEQIEARVRNILACSYPGGTKEVIVASDGSTDRTDDIVRAIGDPDVHLVRLEGRPGKSVTQNAAIGAATGDVVVFTDADTRFEESFVRAIAREFGDPRVGCVDGHLLLGTVEGGVLSGGQSRYWRYELRLRELESTLDMLAVTSGACLAVRKVLLRELLASVGEDCIVPLHVIESGSLVRHAKDAVAFDIMAGKPGEEFQSRVRMTVRNWQGTWTVPSLLNPFRYPRYAFSLWSHKLLRWLSPVFLLAGVTAIFLLARGSPLYRGMAVATLAAAAVAGLGATAASAGRRLPVASAIYSFVLVNLAFLVGLANVALGRKIVTYRS